MTRLETDYLVIGAGASGMAFADALVASCEAEVLLADRRHRPGGHWNDAYPFVRLHVPSACYGVNSTPLGADRIDRHGPNAGWYELAGAAEICDYFVRVLDDVLLPTGRVRFLGMHDYVPDPSGEHRLVSRLTGEAVEVAVRCKVVDARYLEAQVPATHVPSFPVSPDVRFVPVNGLVDLREPASSYVVLGAGKTSIDACLWLLGQGVAPERLRWVRPRDMWLFDRGGWQPLEQVVSLMEGLSLELEALAGAASVEDLFLRLERCGRLLRIDPSVVPTMFRCATVSSLELAQLRQVTDVVRLGRVLRIDREQLVLEGGSVPSAAGAVHVDCTAAGLRTAPGLPIFEGDRITLQQVRNCSPTFNSALIGYLEATRRDDEDTKNRLCPPNPLPDAAEDWLPTFATSMVAARAWTAEPDLSAWVESSRLNIFRGVLDHADEPRMLQALERFGLHVKAGMTRVVELSGQAVPTGAET